MIKSVFFLSTVLLFVTKLPAQEVIVNTLGMEFIYIKPGSMIVGKFQPAVTRPAQDRIESPAKKQLPASAWQQAEMLAKQDAAPGFRVDLPHAYYIGRYEVTQEAWEKVMKKNPSVFGRNYHGEEYPKHPVENITWKQARAFIRKLNKLDKEYIYRLPSEFEWEYAARAGATDDIHWNEIRKLAVLSGKTSSRVGSLQPNAWGMYDMLGNVWEWTADYYNEKIFADPVPPSSGKQRVLKGASFTGDVKNATYLTHAAGPGNGFDVGMRLVMEPRRQ